MKHSELTGHTGELLLLGDLRARMPLADRPPICNVRLDFIGSVDSNVFHDSPQLFDSCSVAWATCGPDKEGESVNHSFRYILREDLPLYQTKTPVDIISVMVNRLLLNLLAF